jgi:NhaP-type Na+/H+ or K+/H+ antiporter
MSHNESFIRLLFEFVPVFFAALVFVYCGAQINKQSTFKNKVIFTLACVNSLLLLLAQISWTWTVYMGDTVGTLLANYTWTIFNTLVMVNYLIVASKDNK